MVISGGTVIEAGANDILRLHTVRTDNNSGLTMNVRSAYTSIQLLKMDDNLDYLRVKRSTTVPGAVGTTFVDVTYDSVDQASVGSMDFTAGSGDVTFNSPDSLSSG